MVGLGGWLSARALVPLLIPPLYLAIVSVVERRWGQAWSGRLTAIPTQTTTVVLIVALTDGPALAGAVAGGALLGVISLSGFAAVYGAASTRSTVGWSVASALGGFGGLAGLTFVLHGPSFVDAGAAAVAVGLTVILLRRLGTGTTPGRRRAIGLPLRMGLATALVLGVAVSVAFVGPIAAGTLGVFPIITAPMTTLNHEESGPRAARRYLEGLEWGLFGGIAFFLALNQLLASQGIVGAFAISTPVLVVVLLVAFFLPERLLEGARGRRRAAVPGPTSPGREMGPAGR